MKLLIDQNISHRLTQSLARIFPGSKHVVDLGLQGADDERVWKTARDGGFAILTKDSDFLYRSMIRGHPPKAIQLRVGNRSTDQIVLFLAAKKHEIRRFLKDRKESLLILDHG